MSEKRDDSKAILRQENISTIFLLPSLRIRAELRDKLYDNGFVNTYLFCDKLNYDFMTPLYVLLKPRKFDLSFYKYGTELEKNQNHVETIDTDEGVVYVYRIPKRFEPDYQLFIQGRYSKFSPELKSCFPDRTIITDTGGKPLRDAQGKVLTSESMFFHIFNRTDYLKNLYYDKLGDEIPLPEELYDKYKVEEETLVL